MELEKAQVVVSDNSFSGVKVENGRLIFESEEEFKETIQYLFENQDDEFALDNKFPNFSSYLQTLTTLADNEYKNFENYPNLVHLVDKGEVEPYLEPVVGFELLKSVLNENGILQIGDKIYKYSDKQVYITKSESAIESLIKNRYDEILDLEAAPITRTDSNVGNRWFIYASCTDAYWWTNSKKVHGIASALMTGYGYDEIYLKTRALKLSWWGWHTFSQRKLRIQGSGHWSILNDPFNNGSVAYSYDVHKDDAHWLKRVIQWNINVAEPFIFDDNNTVHDNYGDADCFLNLN